MPVQYCFLDCLPVEIIHMIFDYLSTCDILHGFLKLSLYIDSIILNYNLYQINFRSILKCDFDLVCQYINPTKMISLVLSDGIDTPYQSDLFLSLFQLEQFYFTLRCLTLEDINDQSMELITNHLDKFSNLSSLTILNNNLIPSSTLKSVFAQLIRLNISCECLFNNLTSMDQLQHLIISNQCTFNELESLIHHAPNLLLLKIYLERENGGNIQGITCNLTRLVLNMSAFEMNMISMKDLLCCFPNLIYFEIECRSDLDLCDGYEWERFLQDNLFNLKRFYFKFQLKSTIVLNTIGIQNILRSFSSSYWLNEKHWFIAIEWNQRLIYSVPRFSCESADSDFRPPFHCTTFDDSIYYDHINALAVWGQTKHRFFNVKELWLVDDPLTMNFELMININRVERLVFVSSKIDISIEILLNLINQMKNVTSIQFYDIPLSFNEYKQGIVIEKIRSIELVRELKSFSSIETLNLMFPQLERLQMKIKSNEDIEKVLNRFSKSLSIVRFNYDTSNLFINQTSIEQLLDHSNFTFAIDHNSIRLWIGLPKISKRIQFEERRTTNGCFSWCSARTRRVLFKR